MRSGILEIDCQFTKLGNLLNSSICASGEDRVIIKEGGCVKVISCTLKFFGPNALTCQNGGQVIFVNCILYMKDFRSIPCATDQNSSVTFQNCILMFGIDDVEHTFESEDLLKYANFVEENHIYNQIFDCGRCSATEQLCGCSHAYFTFKNLNNTIFKSPTITCDGETLILNLDRFIESSRKYVSKECCVEPEDPEIIEILRNQISSFENRSIM